MNGKDIRLIALDLDGTLMGPDHVTVSAANRAALRAAHDKGVAVAAATGRTLSILGDVCEQVPQIGYILYSNGAAAAKRSGEVLYENALSWPEAEWLLDYFDRCPVFLEVYAGGVSYAQADKERFFPHGVFPKIFVEEALKGMTVVESFRAALRGRPVEKFTVYIPDPALLRAVWNELAADDSLAVTSSFPISIDVTKAGADKGAALRGLCESLGLLPAQCVAFGDAENDVPMLQAAGIGVAMGNASDVCKAAADFVTKSNAEDGVALALRALLDL